MRSELSWLHDMMKSGKTERYHNHPMIKSQNVADHTWGVVMCVLWLTNGDASAYLIKSAMYHDVPEKATGDMPGPVKNKHPELRAALEAVEDEYIGLMNIGIALTSEENLILKIADSMELILHAKRDVNMGNRYAMEVYNNGYRDMEGKHRKYSELIIDKVAMIEHPTAIDRTAEFLSDIGNIAEVHSAF